MDDHDRSLISIMDAGHPELDKQHRKLLALYDAFVESFKQEGDHRESVIRNTFASIAVYTELHFVYEASLMQETLYPGTEAHLAEHARVDYEMNEILLFFKEEFFDPSTLIERVLEWRNEIVYDEEDYKLIQFLRGQSDGYGTSRG